MDADLKAKLVKALRGDKYQQARGALVEEMSTGRGFCCLGVLCDIQGTAWTGEGDEGFLDGESVRDYGRSYLSGWMLARCGLTDDQQNRLASLNDDGTPFPEIADYIEANL